jgi:hypothetical protein
MRGFERGYSTQNLILLIGWSAAEEKKIKFDRARSVCFRLEAVAGRVDS